MSPLGGPSDLSSKRTSENLNTPGVLGLASQRSFLQKTNNGLVNKRKFLNHILIFVYANYKSVGQGDLRVSKTFGHIWYWWE